MKTVGRGRCCLRDLRVRLLLRADFVARLLLSVCLCLHGLTLSRGRDDLHIMG